MFKARGITVLGIFGGRVPARFFKSRPCFRPKVPFSTPVFRPDLQNPYPISEKAEIMSSLLRLEGRQKNSSNPFRIRIFLFLSYSFRIETINTFIQLRSRSFSRKPYPIPDQNGQNLYLFSGQKRAKTLPMRRHIPI